MHIVLANQWFPPESGWGGVGMYNYVLAHALVALGHQVTVVASRVDKKRPAGQGSNGIRVCRLAVTNGYRWRRLPWIGKHARALQQRIYSWRMNHALCALYNEQPFDVVEFAEVNAEGFYYAGQPLTPCVVRCHTPTYVLKDYYTPREMSFDTHLIAHSEKTVIRRAHALTAPSQDMARVIARTCQLSAEHIAVIPNPLDWHEFRLDHQTARTEGLIILHVGRLERVKGVQVLAQAIPQILAQVPRVRFVFVGTDFRTERGTSQRAELEEQLVASGVRNQVEFTGKVDQPTLLEWYQRADLCVVPTLNYESFSYTCAQAMAAAKPVVATRIGGIPETIDDGESGLLVEPGDVRQLTDAIVRLAGDTSLRVQMGRAGRAKVEQAFDPHRVAELNLRVYERARETFDHGTA